MNELTTDDGIRIAYDTWGNSGTEPTIVLHHGFAADAAANWVRPGIVDGLAPLGRRILALDARGHGRSDKPHDKARYGEDRMARDLMQLVDHLGLAEYDLVGYSMGGMVSARTGAVDARIRRLVLGGIGGATVEPDLVARQVRRMGRVVEALEADDDATVTDASGRAFRAFARSTGADLRALAAVARGGTRSPLPVERITAATLVLVGAADDLAVQPEVLAAAISGATLRVVPGDHLGAVAKPEFVAALVEFLR